MSDSIERALLKLGYDDHAEHARMMAKVKAFEEKGDITSSVKALYVDALNSRRRLRIVIDLDAQRSLLPLRSPDPRLSALLPEINAVILRAQCQLAALGVVVIPRKRTKVTT